jgi:transposase InsO family protein
MDERVRFIADWRRSWWSFAELCRRYGVSRKTGYKWLERYQAEGPEGLVERSRRPASNARATAPDIVRVLIQQRRRHPTWGPKKLLWLLEQRFPGYELPGRSTCFDLLHKHGLIPRRRKRRVAAHPGPPVVRMDQANAVWTTDFKGHFKATDGEYCYPLTVADGCSRYVLGCQGLAATSEELARPVFDRLFREYGLPDAMLSDNGSPFATIALGRLSRLSVWWIRLGITPILTEPSSPQQNGRHERMHRTLKAEATRPPMANLRAQQRRFDRFCKEFNEERPHEAIGMKPPASAYLPSSRPMPTKLEPLEYPSHFEQRYVSTNGGIRWKCAWVNVSTTLSKEWVGLEEVGDGLWDVYFSTVRLGRLDERRMRIEDKLGRWSRRKLSPMSPD